MTIHNVKVCIECKHSIKSYDPEYPSHTSKCQRPGITIRVNPVSGFVTFPKCANEREDDPRLESRCGEAAKFWEPIPPKKRFNWKSLFNYKSV